MTKHDNVSQGKIMKATEFFKSMGMDAVKGFIKNGNIRSPETELELKRLVESHELVESYGGLSNSRKWIERTVFKLSDSMIALKKAIADVEACQ